MKSLFACLVLLVSQPAFAQYRYDNVAFKTVYWDDLCKSLKQAPDYLLLDVRSKGEYEDTSTSRSLNIGHLKGAKNIDIREIGNRLKEIDAYKNKPVYVYCSHSQRSRRVSKMLTDSGFLHVVNINGGVSNLRMFGWREECNLLTSDLPYQIVSPKSFTKDGLQDYFVLDIRIDSAFKGIASVEKRNALGKFTQAVNMPLATLEQHLASLPKNKKILLVDEFGNESAAAAELLRKNGFSDLAILFNGLDAYITEVPLDERSGWTGFVPYKTINALEYDQMAKKGTLTTIDIRTPEEFSNSSKESFRNIGAIKGAKNIPFADWEKQFISLPADKEAPIVVYAFSSNNEMYEAARKLAKQGYKNVYVLQGGLFNIRWRAANVKNQSQLANWVVNVPPDNQ
jgi:rhodanese-related sulfurtransferase